MLHEEAQIPIVAWEHTTSVLPVLTLLSQMAVYVKHCVAVSEAILLSFKESNLLIELQIICVLLIGIFCSSLRFLDAEKCNKTNCISIE